MATVSSGPETLHVPQSATGAHVGGPEKGEPIALMHQIREDWIAHGREVTKPGFHAIVAHRVGQWSRGLPKALRIVVSPLLFAAYCGVRGIYGIELPYTAKIGRRVVIGHQNGIVVHPGAEIGDDCLIRQNVTVGTGTAGGAAPRLGRNVRLGAGSVISGDILIDDGAIIGPNAVVTTNVPAGAMIFSAPSRVIAPVGS